MQHARLLFFAIVFVFASCSNEETPQVVNIQYELTDDVSPVKVKLKVDGNFHWVEWKYNGGGNYYPNGEEKGMSEYVFTEKGMAIVDFSASGTQRESYTGRLALQIPPVASKVEFTGLSAGSFSDYFPVELGKYKVEFSLHDPYPTVYKSIIIEMKNIQADRLDFMEPVQFDIPRFYDNAEHSVTLAISRITEPTRVFSYNISLKEKYLFDRIYFNKIQIGFHESPMFLEADWKP